MQIPVISLIFQGIPEQIAIVTLTFALCRLPIKVKDCVLLGSLLALFSFVVRLFPITFGIHTILLLGVLFIILNQVYKVNIIKALASSLISLLTLIIIERICLDIITGVSNTSYEDIMTNSILRIIGGLPQVLIIFGVSFVIFKLKKERNKNGYL